MEISELPSRVQNNGCNAYWDQESMHRQIENFNKEIGKKIANRNPRDEEYSNWTEKLIEG